MCINAQPHDPNVAGQYLAHQNIKCSVTFKQSAPRSMLLLSVPLCQTGFVWLAFGLHNYHSEEDGGGYEDNVKKQVPHLPGLADTLKTILKTFISSCTLSNIFVE